MAHRFVRFCKKGNEGKNKIEKIYLKTFSKKRNKLVKSRQVIWGDYLRIIDNYDTSFIGENYLAVRWSPNKNPKIYFIHEDYVTEERPLEIMFLDVGQGDGAILITPEQGKEGKVIVIDAGENENMHRFLKARFAPYHSFNFEAAILTHPDMDHYLGFESIFKNKRLGFNVIYQNGLVERPVSGKFEKLGGITKDDKNNNYYLYNLAQTKEDISNEFKDNSNFGRFRFPPVMNNALNNPGIKDFKMLSTHPAHSNIVNNRAYMPNFSPTSGRPYSIEVLGPVAEEDTEGKIRLKRISSQYGKTKNGHSIILRLRFGKFKILFGGDLNSIAEKFLLKYYTNRKRFPKKGSESSKKMIEDAKKWLTADIMKVCHHGASDVTDEFMHVVNPACYVISSGDQEGHVHPRPDLLGRLGKFGKGESPVLLSTELQRSTSPYKNKSIIKNIASKLNDIVNLSSKSERSSLKTEIKKELFKLSKSNVETFGAIYLKTDGEHLITAFKIEESSPLKKWFTFQYDKNVDSGEINLIK